MLDFLGLVFFSYKDLARIYLIFGERFFRFMELLLGESETFFSPKKETKGFEDGFSVRASLGDRHWFLVIFFPICLGGSGSRIGSLSDLS